MQNHRLPSTLCRFRYATKFRNSLCVHSSIRIAETPDSFKLRIRHHRAMSFCSFSSTERKGNTSKKRSHCSKRNNLLILLPLFHTIHKAFSESFARKACKSHYSTLASSVSLQQELSSSFPASQSIPSVSGYLIGFVSDSFCSPSCLLTTPGY